MAERWVVNASPFIVLSRINQERLLTDLSDEIVLPQAVVDEIQAGPKDDRARQIIDQWPVVEVPTIPAELIAWDLGAGETAILAYAQANPDWTAIIDDGAARKCARSFNISVKGTLGIIISARQRELIPSAADLLRQLKTFDFRLDERLIAEVLTQTVNEEWP